MSAAHYFAVFDLVLTAGACRRLLWCTICFPPSSSFGTRTTGHGGFKVRGEGGERRHICQQYPVRDVSRVMCTCRVLSSKHESASRSFSTFGAAIQIRESNHMLFVHFAASLFLSCVCASYNSVVEYFTNITCINHRGGIHRRLTSRGQVVGCRC